MFIVLLEDLIGKENKHKTAIMDKEFYLKVLTRYIPETEVKQKLVTLVYKYAR